jgi:hypothetical protein
VREFLGKQLGPFPIGGWLLIGTAGVGIAFLATRRRGSSSGTYSQNGASVQPVAFDQSGIAAGSTLGETAGVDDPSWSDVFDAYRAGWIDYQSVAPGSSPPEAGVSPSTGGTTGELLPAEIPTRDPLASLPVIPAPLPAAGQPVAAPAPYLQAPAVPLRGPYAQTIPQAMAEVGGGIDQAARTNVGGIRAFTSFDTESQRILRSGGTVVGGDGRVFKNIIGADGTPHATSIGMLNEVI